MKPQRRNIRKDGHGSCVIVAQPAVVQRWADVGIACMDRLFPSLKKYFSEPVTKRWAAS
jgi:hypothetical protein